MLKAAGWSEPNKDGIIEKDGKPFRVTLVAGGTDINVRWSSLAADQAKQLGIDERVIDHRIRSAEQSPVTRPTAALTT